MCVIKFLGRGLCILRWLRRRVGERLGELRALLGELRTRRPKSVLDIVLLSLSSKCQVLKLSGRAAFARRSRSAAVNSKGGRWRFSLIWSADVAPGMTATPWSSAQRTASD